MRSGDGCFLFRTSGDDGEALRFFCCGSGEAFLVLSVEEDDCFLTGDFFLLLSGDGEGGSDEDGLRLRTFTGEDGLIRLRLPPAGDLIRLSGDGFLALLDISDLLLLATFDGGGEGNDLLFTRFKDCDLDFSFFASSSSELDLLFDDDDDDRFTAAGAFIDVFNSSFFLTSGLFDDVSRFLSIGSFLETRDGGGVDDRLRFGLAAAAAAGEGDLCLLDPRDGDSGALLGGDDA